MNEEMDQATLDRLVEVLSKPDGSLAVNRVLEALYNRMAVYAGTIAKAQQEGRDTYKAYRAMGGGRYLGLEADFKVPPAPEVEVIESVAPLVKQLNVGQHTRARFHKAFTKIELDPGELASFCRLVYEEYGRMPSHAAIGHYFGFAKGSASQQLVRARAAGYDLPTYKGHARTPAGFDAKVARRFGTYENPKTK